MRNYEIVCVWRRHYIETGGRLFGVLVVCLLRWGASFESDLKLGEAVVLLLVGGF